MKVTINHLSVALGSAAILSFAACSHNASQPSTPPRSAPTQTSPTFESNVPSSQPSMGTMPQQSGSSQGYGTEHTDHGAMDHGQQNYGSQGQNMPGQQGMEQPSYGAQDQNLQGQTGTAQGTLNYTELCSSLTEQANVRVDNVQNGVALIITPKAGQTLDTIRDKTTEVERAMSSASNGQPSEGECTLFTMAKEPGTTTELSEGSQSIKITVTNQDPNTVKSLRKDAHDFSMMKK